jgi:hypothetical protein
MDEGWCGILVLLAGRCRIVLRVCLKWRDERDQVQHRIHPVEV